ncbi:MAG TPA: D-alanyl-D-alanine carboxypeptidase [Firmicutes bacterium]|nr:D-alanyl-D-alanine carboxypeptidase [Bacillota bacterium]
MNKCLTRTACILLIVALCTAGSWQAQAEELPVSAGSAILMDRETRRILWEKNIHQARPVASVTKIMTALLALELGAEQELVVVSPRAARTGGSSIWLEQGEKKTLEELVYGLMLCSGNDAAVAIAEHLAGTVEGFASLMTCKARQLGAVNTYFTNPHGLPDDRHYSTAYDLALISCQALGNQKFRNIISTDCRIITWPGNPEGRFLNNQNRLLELYPGADGIKTGWTKKAGRCLAGSATRNNWQLVTVVLDAPEMWEDTMRLLDYGYQTYLWEKIITAGQPLAEVPVSGGEPGYVKMTAEQELSLPLLPGEKERLQYKWRMKKSYRPPICGGEKLGELELYLDNRKLCTVELLAGHQVKKLSIWGHLVRLGRLMLGG